MKRLFVLLFSLLIFVSCDYVEDYINNQYVRVLPTSELSFTSTASSSTLTIESSGKWSISGANDWCTVTPAEGVDGEEIVISVTDNEFEEDRSLELIVSSGFARTTISVVQDKKLETNYVDMGFDNAGTTTQYDANSGVLTITYSDGVVPNIEVGSAVVLPAAYRFDIRVVEDIAINGNTATLETTQGNMCNLFRNTSFTLSTNSNTRALDSNGRPVITPAAVGYLDEQGNYIEVYNALSPSPMASYTINAELWSYEQNYSGVTLFEGGGGRLWWDKYVINAGLNGIFEFDFGEQAGNGILGKVGELEYFAYKMHGSMGADMLMRYRYENSATFKDDKILKYNAIPTKVFKFMVGGVVVPVFVDTHIGQYVELGSSGSVEVSGGVKLSLDLEAGLSWSKTGGTNIIKGATPKMEIYHPTIQAEASAHAKVSYYPQIEIGFYKFIGPWLEPRSYIKEVVEAGFRASTDGESYVGWTDEYFSGLDMRLGLDLDFGVLGEISVFESDVFNVVKDTLLTSSPYRLIRTSPIDYSMSVDEGHSIDLEFKVESFNHLTRNYYACEGAAVVFDVEGGELSHYVAISDASGLVRVNWIPPTTGSNSTDIKLTARIYRSNGEIIDGAQFVVECDPITLNSISYENDYYYYESDGVNYVAYDCTANISGNTMAIENLYSCGIYLHDYSTGGNYKWGDEYLYGNYDNEDIDFSIGVPISKFDKLNYENYIAEATKYGFGVYIEYNDGTYYLSEPKACTFVYDRIPYYEYLSVGAMSVSVTDSYEDDNGETVLRYRAEHPVSYAIDGALWIEYIQDIIEEGDWHFTNTGEQYGESWAPNWDYKYDSTRVCTYSSKTNMYHIVCMKIVTKSGETIYSNSLIYGGTPENPTVSIGGTRASSVVVDNNDKGCGSKANIMSCGYSDGMAIKDIEITKDKVMRTDNLKQIPKNKVRL